MATKNVYLPLQEENMLKVLQQDLAFNFSGLVAAAIREEYQKVANLIVSRHPATVAFIKSLPGWENAKVETGNVTAADVEGKIVAGNLPMALACLCMEYHALEFEGTPPRGHEYTVEDMQAAGAELVRYRVERIYK